MHRKHHATERWHRSKVGVFLELMLRYRESFSNPHEVYTGYTGVNSVGCGSGCCYSFADIATTS